LADARALIAWLEEQVVRESAVGHFARRVVERAAGLRDARLTARVNVTGIADGRVIAELGFCAPIRRSLGGARVRLDPLNLANRKLRLAPQMFFSFGLNTIVRADRDGGDLCERGRDGIVAVGHGHISVLMSMPVDGAHGRLGRAEDAGEN